MRTILVCAMLFGAVALFNTPATPQLLAQDKKKDKGKDTAGGTIEISQGKDGRFRFTIRDADGKFMGNSGAFNFVSEKDAKAAVADFQAVVAKAKVVVLKKKDDDKDDKDEKEEKAKDKKKKKEKDK